MTRAVLLILVVLGACLLGLWLITFRAETEPEPTTSPPATTTAPLPPSGDTLSEDERASVEAYVRANIRQLSPEPEVLGGSFYVTDIEVREDGSGMVSYEDGHIALTAVFTYTIDQVGQPHIDTFTVE